MRLGDGWDDWVNSGAADSFNFDPNNLTPDQQVIQDYEVAFWGGNTLSSSNSGNGMVTPQMWSVITGNDATPEQSAAAYVQSAAQVDSAVPASVVQSWLSKGIDLSNIATAAGAVYKLVAGTGGNYSVQPVNNQAVNAIAAGKAQSKMVLYAGIGLLAAFVVLRRK